MRNESIFLNNWKCKPKEDKSFETVVQKQWLSPGKTVLKWYA